MKTVIIRDRGQITIPDSIRKFLPWLSPMSAITITVTKPNEVVLHPHQSRIDWDQIWANIKKSRAIKGIGKSTSTADFLAADRNTH